MGSLLVVAALLTGEPDPEDPSFGLRSSAPEDPSFGLRSSAFQAAFLDEQARAAYRRGRFAKGLALFLEAHRLAPSASGLFNLGLVAERAGQPRLAYSFWRRYWALKTRPSERRAHAKARLRALERRLALMVITSTPAAAKVFIDERRLGSHGRTPITVAVAPGRHRVLLDLEGHREAAREVRGRNGQRARVHVELVRRTGRLRVDVEPAGAMVFARRLGGAQVRLESGEARALPIGRYRVRAEAEGFRPYALQLQLRARANEIRRLVLSPLPPPRGRFVVSVGALRPQVYVDGQRLAQAPAVLQLSAGPHRVELRLDERSIWTEEVVVPANESVVRLLDERALTGRNPSSVVPSR